MANDTAPSPIRDQRVNAVLARLQSERRRHPSGGPLGDPQASRDPFDYAEPLRRPSFLKSSGPQPLGQKRRSISTTSSTTRLSSDYPGPKHLYSTVFCHRGRPPWQPRPS
jgi:hypothetical protein